MICVKIVGSARTVRTLFRLKMRRKLTTRPSSASMDHTHMWFTATRFTDVSPEPAVESSKPTRKLGKSLTAAVAQVLRPI